MIVFIVVAVIAAGISVYEYKQYKKSKVVEKVVVAPVLTPTEPPKAS